MTLLATIVRIDARRPAVWLAAVGAVIVAWRFAHLPVSGTAVAVAWTVGAALVVAAVGAPLVAPAGTIVGADTWAALRVLWPVAGMLVGTAAAIASAAPPDGAALSLLALLAGASCALAIRRAALCRAASEADGVSLALSVSGAAALAGRFMLPAAAAPWGVVTAAAAIFGALWWAFTATDEGRRPVRPVSSPLVRFSTAGAFTALASPLRRLLVAASMIVSLVGMVAGLFLVPTAAPVAGWVALGCFVAAAVPAALVPDPVLRPAVGRLLASAPGLPAGPSMATRGTGAVAAWWHAAILAWPPLVAALLHLREPARAIAALEVAAVPVLAALATSILGSRRLVSAAPENRLAVALVSAALLAAAALGR